MKINVKNSRIKAKDAEFGMVYLFCNQYIMCFDPCNAHGHGLIDRKHFVRLVENDVSSLILSGNEILIIVGEPVITIK